MTDGTKQPGKNEVTMGRDGIMRMYYRGKQTAEGIVKLSEQSDEFAEQLREQGEPVMILVDVGELGAFGEPEVQAWRRLMATRDFKRMAIVHMNPTLRVVLHFMVKMANRQDRIEVFEDESRAIEWLRETD
ncbi:MAG TPA: STAS/SEC14 domain-containing protein [Patescibacteria group bacterium]